MANDPTNKRVTSFDVARLAGVSRSAVSRAFSDDAVISEKTREKVVQAAEELGYRVNFMARSLKTQHSNLVGIVVSALDTPYRAGQVKIAAREFVRKGFRPILMIAETEAEVESLSAQLFSYNIAGLLVTSATPPSSIFTECHKLAIPIVLVNRGKEVDGVDNIQMDTQQGGELAFEMLTSSGATRLAVVHPQEVSFSVTGRADAFVQACNRASVPVKEFLSTGQTYSDGAEIVKKIGPQVGPDGGIDGVFCATDLLAFGVMDGLIHDFGISIPEQVQLVGFNNIEQSSWRGYELSTIQQDSEAQSLEAVEMMLDRIKNPSQKAKNVVHPVTPVYRKTTRNSHGT